MCSPGEVVPGSRDPGSGRLHRLPWGVVDSVLCLHTGFLVDSGDSLSISCPSLGSKLIAAACAHLWSLLRQCSAFCGHRGKESPLFVHPKQWSLASSAGPDFFPDSLPASCGALAPFRLCSCSQPPSSPWDLTSEARASAPSPHPPQWVSRQASQAGEC